ncbi:MAG: hypothetical protein JNJ40_09900 [Bacteroidia bacterium]|nr:hypothetical protein [Bacteroidia bacterium]
MLKKDFLVRQMEEFGKVMAVILGFKRQQDWDKFEKEIADAALKFTSFEINVIEKMSDVEFEKEILNHPTLTQDQLKIMAELLFEKLNMFAQHNYDANYSRLKVKCIALYSHIQNNLTQNEFDLNAYYKLQILKK